MRHRLSAALAALSALLFTVTAHAGNGGGSDIPEPGTWALVGLAAAVGWAVVRGKRK
jgi:PEP-CTERM motif